MSGEFAITYSGSNLRTNFSEQPDGRMKYFYLFDNKKIIKLSPRLAEKRKYVTFLTNGDK